MTSPSSGAQGRASQSPAAPIPRRLAIVHHARLTRARIAAQAMSDYLSTVRDVQARVVASASDPDLIARVEAKEIDLLVALGGDGTMLRAGHLCAPCGVPVLGVNLGQFGFLIEVQADDWKAALERVLAGNYWLERRMMLRAEHHRGGRLLGQYDAINECVVSRGRAARAVRVATEIDGGPLTTYVADGLIVATATGSTAYALAAGGPILPPELRNILLVAVAPHLSVDRAIVLSEGATVSMLVRTDHEAILSADGQTSIALEDGDRVDVHASPHTVELVRVQDPLYFYRTLAERLRSQRLEPDEAA